MAREPTITISFRAPKSMEVKLDQMAEELGRDRSECIREAISQYLDAGPNSLSRRVGLLEQKVAALASPAASLPWQDSKANKSAEKKLTGDQEQILELNSKLMLAEAEIQASRSVVDSVQKLIEQGGESAELLRWLVEFRRNHPPK